MSLDQDLVTAAERGEIARVRKLLDQGIDPNLPGANGATALHWAGTACHCDLVRTLLSAGALPDLQDAARRTALMYAVVGPQATDWTKWDKSQLSAQTTVEILLAAGADVHLKDVKGDTALSLAERTLKPPSMGAAFGRPTVDHKRKKQLDAIIKLLKAAATTSSGVS